MLDDLLHDKLVFIFDLDGTLIDSMWIWNRTDAILLSELANVDVDEQVIGKYRDDFLAQIKSTTPYLEYVIYLKSRYNLPQSVEEIREYRNYIALELMKTINLKPYAKELLEFLKSINRKVCLVTTSTKRHVEDILYVYQNTRVLGDNIFDAIISQNDVVNLKPSPDAHLLLQERLGFKKSDAVIIEDSTIGIGAAQAAEIDCITVKEEHNLEQDKIKTMSTYYVDSLKSIYDTMQEIYENKPKKRVL